MKAVTSSNLHTNIFCFLSRLGCKVGAFRYHHAPVDPVQDRRGINKIYIIVSHVLGGWGSLDLGWWGKIANEKRTLMDGVKGNDGERTGGIIRIT
jgi:hypothetical protein